MANTTCDRCLDAKATGITFLVDKNIGGVTSSNKIRTKRILSVRMTLCDVCVNELMLEFGGFTAAFLMAGEEETDKTNVLSTSHKESQ